MAQRSGWLEMRDGKVGCEGEMKTVRRGAWMEIRGFERRFGADGGEVAFGEN